MKYFITGATGFIGGRVARQLVEKGHEVTAIARTPARAQDLRARGVSVHEGDITDKQSLRGPMTGVDGVFHIAAWYKLDARDKRPAEAINVGGTRNVLEVMADLKIPKGVYTSTLGVFSDTRGRVVDETYRSEGPSWLSEYERTKGMAHYQVAVPMMEAGLPLVIVMPGVVYGPGDTSMVHETFVRYLRGKMPIAPQRTAFCWAHVDDVAAAHILAMEKGRPGETYIIAGDVHTLHEVFEVAERITAIRAPRIHPSPAVMKALAGLMGVVGAVLPVPESSGAESLRAIAGATYLGSNAKARRELEYHPRPLEEGLRETLRYEMDALGLGAGRA